MAAVGWLWWCGKVREYVIPVDVLEELKEEERRTEEAEARAELDNRYGCE